MGGRTPNPLFMEWSCLEWGGPKKHDKSPSKEKKTVALWWHTSSMPVLCALHTTKAVREKAHKTHHNKHSQHDHP